MAPCIRCVWFSCSAVYPYIAFSVYCMSMFFVTCVPFSPPPPNQSPSTIFFACGLSIGYLLIGRWTWCPNSDCIMLPQGCRRVFTSPTVGLILLYLLCYLIVPCFDSSYFWYIWICCAWTKRVATIHCGHPTTTMDWKERLYMLHLYITCSYNLMIASYDSCLLCRLR